MTSDQGSRSRVEAALELDLEFDKIYFGRVYVVEIGIHGTATTRL